MESEECICMCHGGLMIKRILALLEGTILSFGEVWACLPMEPEWGYNISMVVSNEKEKIKKLEDTVSALKKMSINIMVRWLEWLDVVRVFHSMIIIVKLIQMWLINTVSPYCVLIITGLMRSVSRQSICRILSKNYSIIWVLQLSGISQVLRATMV